MTKRECIYPVPERCFGSIVDGVVPLHLQELLAAIHKLGRGVFDATLCVLTVGHVPHGNGLGCRHTEIIANGKAAQIGQHVCIWGQSFVQGIMGTLIAGVSQQGFGGGVALSLQGMEVCGGACGDLTGDLGCKGLHHGGVEVKVNGELGCGHGCSKKGCVQVCSKDANCTGTERRTQGKWCWYVLDCAVSWKALLKKWAEMQCVLGTKNR